MIHFRCPKCKDQLSVDESLAGQTAECPNCGNVAAVPEALPSADAPAASNAPPQAVAAPSGEGEMLWSGSPSWKAFLPIYILMGMVAAGGAVAVVSPAAPDGAWMVGFALIAVSGLIILAIELYRAFTEFHITDQVVYFKTGVIARQITEVRVGHLREITLVQGPIERLLDVGKLGFSTAASSGVEIVWRGIDQPQAVRNLVRKLIL